MLKIWKAGEESTAICPTCEAWRPTKFAYRTVHLDETDVDVDHVLVGVCTVCGTVATIPHQSTPQLKAARERELKQVETRLPRELRDVLGVLAERFDARVEPFSGGLVRYYLGEVAGSPTLAKRIQTLAVSDEARGTAGGRLTFKVDTQLYDRAWQVASKAALRDKSAMVRGIIVAAKHDVYDRPSEKRVDALKAVARAAVAG